MPSVNHDEKDRREYYQSIVYDVCNILDRVQGRKPGSGIVCGTVEHPSREVQSRCQELADEVVSLRSYLQLAEKSPGAASMARASCGAGASSADEERCSESR